MDSAWEALLGSLPALSDEEKAQLDGPGFVIFPRLIDDAWRDRLLARLEQLFVEEGSDAGREVHQEQGTRRLANLVDKGEVFAGVYQHPRVLAAVYHLLRRPFKLSSLNARDALPGAGGQGLHADWGKRDLSPPFSVVNSLWMLDDLTEENGATRLIPGSQHLVGAPSDYVDPLAPHPGQVLAVAPAGSVLVWNAHTWHGGTENRSSGSRRALHCYYVAREHPQQTEQARFLSDGTKRHLRPEERYLLDL